MEVESAGDTIAGGSGQEEVESLLRQVSSESSDGRSVQLLPRQYIHVCLWTDIQNTRTSSKACHFCKDRRMLKLGNQDFEVSANVVEFFTGW